MTISKQELKNSQPVAWKILSAALKTGKISHAYLLHGPKGAPLSEMALLFVQSLFCRHRDEDGFACRECESCRRIAAEETPDVFWLHPGGLLSSKPMSRKELSAWWNAKKEEQDGETEKKKKKTREFRIRKEDIAALQDGFAASALEGGRQAYILEEYDRATPEASNSLLKFFEEPREGLTGILCSHHPEAILPTILSRAQMVPFRPASRSARAEEIGMLLEDSDYAQMLADAGYTRAQAEELIENIPVFEIRDAAEAFWKNRTSCLAVCELQLGVLNSRTGCLSRESLQLFFAWLLRFMKKEELNNPEGILEMRLLVLESMDALRKPVDLALLADRTCGDIVALSIRQRRA